MMLLVMFSLAGVPPTVGFYAKFAVIQAAVDAGFVWLAVVAVMASLVGAFYYLRVVKLMYFDDATDTAPIAARGRQSRAAVGERPRACWPSASCRSRCWACASSRSRIRACCSAIRR